jgi:RNA polymerase sigma-70 factor (ECF subfamily)
MTVHPPHLDRRLDRPFGRTSDGDPVMTSHANRPLPTGGTVTHEQAQALEALYVAHARPLRGRLITLTHDTAVADDLVSEAFLRLAMELRAGRAPIEPRAWLYRVGANLVVSRARRASTAFRAMPGLVERGVAASPEDEIVSRETDGLLRQGLAALGCDDREIVVLAAQGYRADEIARLLGCSVVATRTRLCRARGRLRARLELAGLTA